jgi:hypothetical protein
MAGTGIAGMSARYAIYYTPEEGSPLAVFGRTWFDEKKNGNPKALANLNPKRLAEVSEATRKYGFHGTLKPPFSLNPSTSPESLLSAARVFARSLSPIEIPPLELAIIGKFIALTPTSQSAALEKLSAACVRAFEAYRVPLSDEQLTSYKQNKLTVHQEQMLEHWGYPYVMEEFRFHISVTDRIDDPHEREEIIDALEKLAGAVLSKPVPVREISVFTQASPDAPMVLLERIPFGRSK